MEFKEAAAARKSVRDYTSDPVKMEVLRDIVETAGRAASWCNAQPWKVYAVMGEKLELIRAEWAKRLAAEEPMAMDFEGIHREEMTELATTNMGEFFATVARQNNVRDFEFCEKRWTGLAVMRDFRPIFRGEIG